MEAKTEGMALGPPVTAFSCTRFSACKKPTPLTPDPLASTSGGRNNVPAYQASKRLYYVPRVICWRVSEAS